MLIAASQLLTAERGAEPVPGSGFVELTDGVIARVGFGPPLADAGPSPDVTLPDGYLVPGFVDLQVNGYFGAEFQTADAGSWASVARKLPSTGTTSFVPTLITAPVDSLAAALRTAAGFAGGLPAAGARMLGAHLEGPFISPARRGAHNPAWIIDPTRVAIDELIEAGQGLLRLLTLAPERPGALDAIDQLVAAGVLVSVGHSDATAEQVSAAADHGARMVTHLFNAQRPLAHREPGVVGQALTDERLTSGLIADLYHVAGPSAAWRFVPRPAGSRSSPTPRRRPACRRGSTCSAVSRSRCRRPTARRLSVTTAPWLVRRYAWTSPSRTPSASGIALADAVAAATRIPADLIGRPELGRISQGAAADLVWLGPDLRTRATWIAGRLVYTDGAAATMASLRA